MYLLSYFRTEAEALHLALSDDGLRWRALNRNRPVLAGAVGARTLRDPFLLPAPSGGFHLLATDGWTSPYLVHAYSPDLLSWGEQRLLPAMAGVHGARNAWAPEAFRDEAAGAWRVLWSSTVSGADDGGAYDHRIWSATADDDFAGLSEPGVFFDPGHSVIDACVVRDGAGRYLLAYKDERGENRAGTDHKAIHLTRADSAGGPWSPPSAPVSPPLTEGPTLYRLPDGAWCLLYDCFLDARFGAAVSHDDGETWEDASARVSLPVGPRHASVCEVGGEVAEGLLGRWG